MTQRYFTRGFTIALIAVFIAFFFTLFLSASRSYLLGATPEGIATAENMRQTVESQRQTITPQDIFINNLLVSSVLFLPLVGLFIFITILLNTGYVLGLLSTAYNASPLMYVVSIFSVGGWIEMMAYTFLAAENIYILFLVITQSGAAERLKNHSWKTALIYITLLLVGAVWEGLLLA